LQRALYLILESIAAERPAAIGRISDLGKLLCVELGTEQFAIRLLSLFIRAS
jgi:hypothetical protein